MNSAPLTIWCNAHFPHAALAELRERVGNHTLVFPSNLHKSNLAAGGVDPTLAEVDVALGQPDPQQIMQLPRLKWVHLTTAGYTRYDRDDLREAFRRRGAVLTNSSAVYAEPCAEHVFAMMLSMARRLPQCVDDQRGSRPWHAAEHRERSHLLLGQTVLILGFGAIANRLVELLAPFRMNITAVRRRPSGKEPCRVVPTEQTDSLLPAADHVVNILPANPATEGFLTRHRLGLLKPAAFLYNIGRGTTIDQPALVETLQQRKIAGAYLDVMDPEPLPPEHPLWSLPNCYITPHTAGGQAAEFHRLVEHFADNLDRFVVGKELRDRVD
ncbi:MAG: putative 2-hydroxyacid dehydrogenase [Phycisphaerales bacterium]|nr:putative 2-hydroxyacid dehydrogenase [Phycisphaerales bacterium]